MKFTSKGWAVLCFALFAGRAIYGAPVTVDSVGALNPNPSNLATTEVGNTSLTAARALVAAAHTAGTGGTIDFQQKFQGGTFPNATSSNNGVDVADGVANALQVTASNDGAGTATGAVIFSFYRVESAGGTNNIDSNTNQGINTISGGYKSRDPIATGTAVLGTVDFATIPPTPDPVSGGTTGVGGAYMGITGTGSPATFVFNNGLSFFGITALPRGATRDTLIALTETPIGGGAPISVPIGGATVVGTSAVFFGQTANAGFTITGATFTNPNGQGVNRYDDMAFVVAVPEPTSLALLVIGGVPLAFVACRANQRGREAKISSARQVGM
jgi:hypothetical protein